VVERAGGEGGGVDITICAHDLEVQVDLVVRPGAESHADTLQRALAEELRRALFADDERPVEELVLDLAREQRFSIAAAESCTGGLVAARLTSVPGSSEAFAGGVVAYDNRVKRELLAVSDGILSRHGAVSAETAAAMAQGIRRALGADVGVSVTGIAGPGGGTPEKPVGLVFISVESPGGASTRRFELPGDREAVRSRATGLALHMLRRVLAQSGTPARASES
jgi:nicotinamide-nucleotide amidase